MNFVTEKDVVNLIKHSEATISKDELLDIINKQRKEVLDILNKELKDSVLTKKDVIDLIKKECGKNSKQ